MKSSLGIWVASNITEILIFKRQLCKRFGIYFHFSTETNLFLSATQLNPKENGTCCFTVGQRRNPEFLNDDKIARTRWRQKSEKKSCTLIEILHSQKINKQTKECTLSSKKKECTLLKRKIMYSYSKNQGILSYFLKLFLILWIKRIFNPKYTSLRLIWIFQLYLFGECKVVISNYIVLALIPC